MPAASLTPRDLEQHRCINLRLPTKGNLYAWDFEKRGRAVQVRVQGQVVLNNTLLMLQAALDGLGLCCVPEDLLQPCIDAGHAAGAAGLVAAAARLPR